MGVRFEVFGGVRAVGASGPLALRPQVARLLGVLLAEPCIPVPVERIVDRMWRDDPPATSTKIVHVSIGRLRAALDQATPGTDGSLLRTTPDGYVLIPAPDDIAEYDRAVARVRQLRAVRPDAALAAIADAFTAWRGRPWGDDADAPWLRERVGALEEQHRRLEETWADLMLECGRAGEAVEVLRAAAGAEPLRERRWAQLMTALYRSGRQADALREYERVRRLLRDDLGIEPGPELRRLELAILHQDPTLQRAEPQRADVYAPTSFVGREDEIAALTRAVDRDRLVTVTGIGGIGKSRLAAEFAHRARLSGETVRRISCSGLEAAEQFDGHAARQLGLFVDDGSALAPVLAAAVADAQELLVVDAAERAQDEVGHLVLNLLHSCPRARVLITARVPLGLGVEREFRLKRLPEAIAGEPMDGTDLELMLDRAGFDAVSLDPETLDALRRSCRAAGGIPLLIELVARSTSWESGAVAETVGAEPVQAAIANSLDALDRHARGLVVRASVLPGGLTESVAAHVGDLAADDARRALRQLAWLHLVDAFPGARAVRYRSLDPIRAALLEDLTLSERDDALGRATAAVQNLVDRLWPNHTQPVVLGALDDVADEHDNLRFLLGTGLVRAPAEALELAIGASDYWAMRGHVIEGRDWLHAAMDAAQPAGSLRWRAALALVRATRTMPETAQLRDLLESATAEARADGSEPVLLGGLLLYLAIARAWQGDRSGAAGALDEATQLDRIIGSEWTRAHLDHLRALDLALTGNFAAARQGQLAFAARMLELDDPAGAATGRYLAATVGEMMGAGAVLSEVRADLAASRELAEHVGDVSLLSRLLLLEARVLQEANDERSRAMLLDAVERLTEQGGIGAAALARRDVGLLALRDGAYAEAEEHLRSVAPVLLRLDRTASTPAWAGLALLHKRRGETRTATTFAAAARTLRQPGAPHRVDDERRVGEILSLLDLPGAPDAVTDEELLALVAD